MSDAPIYSALVAESGYDPLRDRGFPAFVAGFDPAGSGSAIVIVDNTYPGFLRFIDPPDRKA